ncbi:hypothetical protein EAG_13060 [Camponotus floridanus]|uniref:Uncharacterized protein n=1 Tax=Camponotus floridanus TaxID=104421 RepID=E2AN31_CAMFO|nr:hypothetical protein EAG_13060 [Camponotus floridanus]
MSDTTLRHNSFPPTPSQSAYYAELAQSYPSLRLLATPVNTPFAFRSRFDLQQEQLCLPSQTLQLVERGDEGRADGRANAKGGRGTRRGEEEKERKGEKRGEKEKKRRKTNAKRSLKQTARLEEARHDGPGGRPQSVATVEQRRKKWKHLKVRVNSATNNGSLLMQLSHHYRLRHHNSCKPELYNKLTQHWMSHMLSKNVSFGYLILVAIDIVSNVLHETDLVRCRTCQKTAEPLSTPATNPSSAATTNSWKMNGHPLDLQVEGDIKCYIANGNIVGMACDRTRGMTEGRQYRTRLSANSFFFTIESCATKSPREDGLVFEGGTSDKGLIEGVRAKVDGLRDRGRRREKGSEEGCFSSCFTVGQSPPHISDATRPSIKLRERTTYVPDLVCPPTSVITFASVTTLRRCLRGGTCSRNSLMAAAAPFIDSPPMYLMICREYDLISRSLPPLELYGYLLLHVTTYARCLGFIVFRCSAINSEQEFDDSADFACRLARVREPCLFAKTKKQINNIYKKTENLLEKIVKSRTTKKSINLASHRKTYHDCATRPVEGRISGDIGQKKRTRGMDEVAQRSTKGESVKGPFSMVKGHGYRLDSLMGARECLNGATVFAAK